MYYTTVFNTWLSHLQHTKLAYTMVHKHDDLYTQSLSSIHILAQVIFSLVEQLAIVLQCTYIFVLSACC